MVPILEMTQVEIKRGAETWKEANPKIEDLHPRGHQIKGPNPYSKRTNINSKPQRSIIREDTDHSNQNVSFLEKSFADETQRGEKHQSFEHQTPTIDAGAFDTGSNSHLSNGVRLQNMLGSQYNDDSAAISPHVAHLAATHYRHQTINPASVSTASYRPQRSTQAKKQSGKL
jgi:hypothetical protein